MDKGSLPPHSQPSNRSGRRATPNESPRPVNRPSAHANVTPGPSSMATAQSHVGPAPGWHPQQPPAPPPGPGNIDEVARALRTIQDAYPFLVQSVAYHQQGPPNQIPSGVPHQPPPQPPWPSNQSSTSHRETTPQYTPGFGQLGSPGTSYSPASAPYSTSHLPTPHATVPGQSSFQAVIPTHTPEGVPIDAEAIAEEKRKRNTAASARFRAKKKVHTHSLERHVTDLSGRVDELEQEAADLKRENGWLKDIVMLKSGRARGSELLAGSSQPPSSQESGDDGDEDSEGRGSTKGRGKRSGA